MREARGEDIALPGLPQPESKVATEQLTLREKFTDAERAALETDGAVIYPLRGETILTQRESQARKGKPAFWFLMEAGDRLLAIPSRQVEVAIYPAVDRFFVPGTFNQDVKTQEELVAKDAQDLRKRLGLEGIGEIIPDEASTLTDITFQHLDKTNEWLFGQKYAAAQGLDWVYGRTKNPTNSSGSDVAHVGNAYPGHGLGVNGWHRGHGNHRIGAVRLVLPIETK